MKTTVVFHKKCRKFFQVTRENILEFEKYYTGLKMGCKKSPYTLLYRTVSVIGLFECGLTLNILFVHSIMLYYINNNVYEYTFNKDDVTRHAISCSK